MTIDPWRTAFVVVFILFLAALTTVLYKTGAERDAQAVAGDAQSLAQEAAVLASSLADEAREVRELADEKIEEADRKRIRAEERAEALEANAAALSLYASQTGQAVLEAVQEAIYPDSSIVATDLLTLVTAHLAADADVVSSFEERLELKDEVIAAVEVRAGAFEMRAVASERALEASQVECQACRLEAAAWEKAANPGWFTRLRTSLPAMSLTAVATVAVLLIL